MEKIKPHISVCIPTYKRPSMLRKCLEAILDQNCSGFTCSIVIIDNDIKQSAKDVFRELQQRAHFEIYYDVEPVQNISLARNRAIQHCRGELIAFIDDDEYPEPEWLPALFAAYMHFSADGVLGPVIPFYEGEPPRWLLRSGLCDRTTFETGTILNRSAYMRTGNALVAKHIFADGETLFNPRLGRSGGEDSDLFERMLLKGYSFVWCQEARVYEAVPEERQKRIYFVRRALIRGVTRADMGSIASVGTAKSLAAVFLYTLLLPFLLIVGHHLFMRYLVKDCDHAAKLLALCGLRIAQERRF